jgi:hypothetical protein
MLANAEMRGAAFALVPKKYNFVSTPRKPKTGKNRCNADGDDLWRNIEAELRLKRSRSQI